MVPAQWHSTGGIGLDQGVVMVDSIHQTGRIGGILPPGQLRKVGHRNQSRKDSREEGGTESQTAEEDARADDPDFGQEALDGQRNITAPSDKPNNRRTGRRIDVRI